MTVSMATVELAVRAMRDGLDDLEDILDDYAMIVSDDGADYDDALDDIESALDCINNDMDEIAIWLKQERRAAFMMDALIIKKPGAATAGPSPTRRPSNEPDFF